MDIFRLNNRLLLGTLIVQTKVFPTFDFVKSVFTSGYYNFISPTVPGDKFAWNKSEKIIQEQKALGYNFSYYLKIGSEYEILKQPLSSKGYQSVMQDSYAVKLLKTTYLENLDEYILVTKELLDKYINLSKICFPDWENNDEFCQRLFAAQENPSETMTENYLVKKQNTFVGIFSAISLSKHNISYLTNMGTLPKFRGQGIQKSAIKFHCNQCLTSGITRVYAIVEPDTISYHNFAKLGFQEEARYEIFSSQHGSSA